MNKGTVEVRLDFRASQSLALEGLRNEISRLIQTQRKSAGLNITDKPVVGFYCSDPYICAAARHYSKELMEECLMKRFEVHESEENSLVISHYEVKFNTDKWHSSVGITPDGEFSFKVPGYKHYWEALDAWEKSNG